MAELDGRVLELVAEGENKLAENERMRLANEARAEAARMTLKQGIVEKVTRFLDEQFPGFAAFANVEEMAENCTGRGEYGSLRVEFPGFAPLLMAITIKDAVSFDGVKWPEMILSWPNPDELGFDCEREVAPQWTWRYSDSIMDMAIALAMAKKQGQLYAEALERWEVEKARLIEEQRLWEERKAAEASYEQMRAEINLPNAMAAQMLGMASCSKKERALLDALAGYLYWLDEEWEGLWW